MVVEEEGHLQQLAVGAGGQAVQVVVALGVTLGFMSTEKPTRKCRSEVTL